MSITKIKKKLRKPKTKNVEAHPRYHLEQKRTATRRLEEFKLYQLIQDKEFDLWHKDDLGYLRERAEKMGWNSSKLIKVIGRIWSVAKRDIQNESKRSECDKTESDA